MSTLYYVAAFPVAASPNQDHVDALNFAAGMVAKNTSAPLSIDTQVSTFMVDDFGIVAHCVFAINYADRSDIMAGETIPAMRTLVKFLSPDNMPVDGWDVDYEPSIVNLRYMDESDDLFDGYDGLI